MDEQALEAAARAMHSADVEPRRFDKHWIVRPWGEQTPEARTHWTRLAQAAITAYLEASGEARDSKRLDYLETRFSCHWDGTIGRAPTWHLVGSIICGNTLREAIDTALEGGMKPETAIEISDRLSRQVGTETVQAVLGAFIMTEEGKSLVADARRKECFWTSDGDDSPWEGSCGVAWIFIDGGPEENKMSYCPQCGGKLTAQTYDEVESEDAAIDAARAE